MSSVNQSTPDFSNEQGQRKELFTPFPEQLPFPGEAAGALPPLSEYPSPSLNAPSDGSVQGPQQFSAFGGAAEAPKVTQQLLNDPISPNGPNITRQLTTPFIITGALHDTQTGTFTPLPRTTTSLREPVVIRGSQKSRSPLRPPKGRRVVVNVAATSLLVCIILATLVSVLPVDNSSARGGFNLFQPIVHLVKSNNNSISLVAQQATVTAVTQDGFDPSNGQTYAGLPTAPPVVANPDSPGSTLGRFLYGQCTYWADLRYHQMTGHWVAWFGNAYQWVYGAQSYGWTVSSVPHVPSIVVLMPGVQGAGPFGHVAVVESVNSDGSATTSNYNWAGNWANVTYVRFYPGSGVYFVSYPGT